MSSVSDTKTPANARLDSKHAIAVASRFLATIGQPSLNPMRASYVGHGKRSDEDYYQPLWRIQFAKGPGILVSDKDGSAVSYSYGPEEANINRFPDVPAGVDLSREEAIERAIQILAASGLDRSELSPPDAQVMNITGGNDFGDRMWVVSWDRVKSGIPYEDQGGVVGLQSETGLLTNLMIRFTTVSAASTQVTVDKKRAIALARSSLKHSHITDAHITGSVLKLTPYLAKGGKVDPDIPPAPFWHISFTRGSGDAAVAFDIKLTRSRRMSPAKLNTRVQRRQAGRWRIYLSILRFLIDMRRDSHRRIVPSFTAT